MTEPKFKLGDDGELEEIIEDFGEKPKRKRKPHNRILYIPMSLMLALIVGVALFGLVAFSLTHPSEPVVDIYPTFLPHPSKTPGGVLDRLPPCGLFPLQQKPRFVFSLSVSLTPSELIRIDADGTNNCRLTNNNSFDSDPTWSPDGMRIAFSSQFDSAGYNFESAIYIMDANGENINKLTYGFLVVSAPDWSPDGKQIAFQGTLKGTNNSEIFIINIDGTSLNNLTNNPGIDISPNWSPDGQSIVFVSGPEYQYGIPHERNDQFANDEIYIMDANGTNLKQLTFNKQQEDFPRWSPDGQWLAYRHMDDIYFMDKNGKHSRRLTVGANVTDPPFWLEGGNEIGMVIYSDAIQFMNMHTGQTRSLRVLGIPAFVDPWWPPTTS